MSTWIRLLAAFCVEVEQHCRGTGEQPTLTCLATVQRYIVELHLLLAKSLTLFRFKQIILMPGIVCIAESHQVLAQLLDTLLVIGTQLPENPTVRHRLIEVACKVFKTQTADSVCTLYHYK